MNTTPDCTKKVPNDHDDKMEKVSIACFLMQNCTLDQMKMFKKMIMQNIAKS